MARLNELAEDFYVAESAIRFYGVRLRTRMAVVRFSDERLFVYSPVFLEPAIREELDALGRVSFIVSPNKIHNQTLAEYQLAYPDAQLFAPPGLPERRPDLRFASVLNETTEEVWESELDQTLTGGNLFFSEALFLHRSSGTLLVGDFVENIGPGDASSAALLLARLFGVRPRPMASPEFRYYTHDEDAARSSLAVARGWDFERIFLCHGALVDENAAAVFDQVCEELLATTRRRSAFSRWATSRLAAFQ